MLLRLTKQFRFEMAHALPAYEGKCRNIHGHSYKLFVTVEGVPLQEKDAPTDGMVLDFHLLSQIVTRLVVDPFDHALVLPSTDYTKAHHTPPAGAPTPSPTHGTSYNPVGMPTPSPTQGTSYNHAGMPSTGPAVATTPTLQSLQTKFGSYPAKLILVGFQPTTENLLMHFASLLSGHLPSNVRLHSLRLYETETSCAELIL